MTAPASIGHDPDHIPFNVGELLSCDPDMIRRLLALVEADTRQFADVLQAIADHDRQALEGALHAVERDQLDRIAGKLWLTELSPAQLRQAFSTEGAQ